MRALLDTHLLLWALVDDAKLPQPARAIIEDETNQILFSAASAWEVSIKHSLHPDRLAIGGREFIEHCEEAGYEHLPIAGRHVLALETLMRPKDAAPHSDPFDRIMVSQAKADGLVFLTHDALLPSYGEACVLYV